MEQGALSRVGIRFMDLKRHTLVDVSDEGREFILAELAGSGNDSDVLRDKFGRILLPHKAGVRVPGIVRREEESPRSGSLPLGFCEPVLRGESRLRIAAFARMEDVVRVVTPYELISTDIPTRTASMAALADAVLLANELDIVPGVWGSAAMELYTGLPCTHAGSDLDLLVAAAPHERLFLFMKEIKLMERRFALRIDVELDHPNGYGVQLKEFFGQGRTVLGKSIKGVELFPREQLVDELPNGPSVTS